MNRNRKKVQLIFVAVLVVAILLFAASIIKTNIFNQKTHTVSIPGAALFSGQDASEQAVSVRAVPRSSTWTKVIDPENEGLTEPNFQAYTYDFTISNNTDDEVASFTFKLNFGQDTFLASAWNGALELHQFRGGAEQTDTIPDLRDYNPDDYGLETVAVDGEAFIFMRAGDYLRYLPSASMNAMEIPIEPREGTTPGFILYTAIDEGIDKSSLELEYVFHRLLTSEPLFWLSLAAMAIWLIVLVIFVLTSFQIRRYNERHQRDNEIITESIETFTGFIDAKDPYTNGHSKRVAVYTRQLAEQMGYEGEELDRIFYIALLHDCGKIGVPDSILGKPGKLTQEEFEIIKSHTQRGAEILSSFKSLEDADEGAHYHHERYDGKGYPEGKAGEDIPLVARIICVADSFDAMNSDRVYRKRLKRDRIISEIEKNKGLQFDPRIADIMLDLIRSGRIPTEE